MIIEGEMVLSFNYFDVDVLKSGLTMKKNYLRHRLDRIKPNANESNVEKQIKLDIERCERMINSIDYSVKERSKHRK